MRQAWDIPDRGIIFHFGERDEWARVLEFCAPYVPKVHRLLVNVEPDAWSLTFEQKQSLRKLFTPELKELRYYDAHNAYRVADNCPADGIQHCLNLEELTVSLRSLTEWSFLIGGLTNLKRLTVVGDRDDRTLGAYWHLTLTRLEPVFAGLESLTICVETNYTAGVLIDAVSGKAPKLKSLSVTSRKAAADDAPIWIENASFPALEDLHTNGMLMDLDSDCSNKLSLLALDRIRDSTCLNNLIRRANPETLRKMWLHSCNFRLNLVKYISGLPRLEHCDLGECRYNGDDLQALPGYNPSKFAFECHGDDYDEKEAMKYIEEPEIEYATEELPRHSAL